MKPIVLAAIAITLTLASATAAADEHTHTGMMQPNMMKMAGPTIDVPVTIKDAHVLFRIDRVVPSRDNHLALQQITVLSEKLRQMGANAKIVVVFNGDGGFMALNDEAYNEIKSTKDGNPYKTAIENLLAQGVEVEECGMTMMRERWRNNQLLPEIKVNTGANLRVIDLVQKGYVLINI